VNILGFSQRLEKAFGEALEVLEHAPRESLCERLEPILKERIPAALRFIQASGIKMDSLINGLLRISRVGRVELMPEALDMGAMLKHILDAMAFQLQKAEAQVTLGRLPACLADANQVNQVFTNLVDNALKYRDPKRPLQVDLWGESKNGQVVYCVRDTGLGIPPENLEKIWGIFHRLDPNDGVGGEGLGLAMVQRMVARNGGRTWVESEVQQGSRFFVELPSA
jgi:signal transduction histidine kinase